MSRKTRIADKFNKNRKRWPQHERESREAIRKIFSEIKETAPAAGHRGHSRESVATSGPAERLMERLRDQVEQERALDNLFPRRGRRRRKQT
jgi:hypothetical protein